MRAVTGPGRWVWVLSGLVTAAALTVPGTRLLTHSAGHNVSVTPDAMTRTVTVPQPVVSLTVQSYGAPVRVTTGPVRRVQVTETFFYDDQDGGPLAVAQSVSGGRLTLAAPAACASSGCSVGFAVTVPAGVTVTVASEGGPVTVTGTAGANLDSGGGQVQATRLDGPLTVSTGGGSLQVNGLAGGLRADTDGGDLVAQGVAAATARVSTQGGQALIAFAAAPDTVTVSTDGGPAQLTVPGGPYLLTADSDGGPESLGIASDLAASRSITVFSGGGPLRIEPSGSRR